MPTSTLTRRLHDALAHEEPSVGLAEVYRRAGWPYRAERAAGHPPTGNAEHAEPRPAGLGGRPRAGGRSRARPRPCRGAITATSRRLWRRTRQAVRQVTRQVRPVALEMLAPLALAGLVVPDVWAQTAASTLVAVAIASLVTKAATQPAADADPPARTVTTSTEARRAGEPHPPRLSGRRL